MALQTQLLPMFVEFIPKNLETGLIYVSIEFNTTAHLCACGCGNRVVLPLRPTDWRMTYDGRDVTMRPSVGNWGFECRSHYFITSGKIERAGDWSDEQILLGRRADAARRDAEKACTRPNSDKRQSNQSDKQPRQGIWERLRKALFGGGSR